MSGLEGGARGSKRGEGHARRIVRAAAVALMVIGVAVFAVPYVTNLVYNMNTDSQQQRFSEFTGVHDPVAAPDGIASAAEWSPADPDPRLQALYELMVDRNKKLADPKHVNFPDPHSYETDDIDLSDYGLDDGIVGFLEVPTMNDVTLPIVLGGSEDQLARGAAHLTGTSYPVGGPSTNALLAAHRGWTWSSMFRDIEMIQVGDPIYIQNFHDDLEYRVVDTRIIMPWETDVAKVQPGRDLVTLITCHPLTGSTERYVVVAERVG